MTAETVCSGQVADDVFMQTENLHRPAGVLRKWSKALLKRTTKTVGTGEAKSQKLLAVSIASGKMTIKNYNTYGFLDR